MAKHIQFDDYGNGHNANCVACEELFADALDDLFSPADRVFFDRHLHACAGCSESFAQAQRGAAWLELLKTSRPEPSAKLLERILAETARAPRLAGEPHSAGAPADIVILSEAKDSFLATAPAPVSPNVIPFIPRPVPRPISRFTRLAMEPRLAMTAAMAFFSIALTLSLLGVRLDQIKAANLSRTNLKQAYFQANATAVRYYDNLKVVRVLESRVDDIRESNAAPAAEPKSQPEIQPEKPHGSSRRELPLPAAPNLPNILSTQLELDTEPLRRPLVVAAPQVYDLKQEGGLA